MLRRTPAAILAVVSLSLPGALLAAVGGPAETPDRPLLTPRFVLPESLELSPQAQELSLRYRDVFRTLADGDRKAAVESAAAIEAQALAAHPGKAIEWLNQADGILLSSYLRSQPDCALPLVLFYERLALLHSARRSYPLIQRAMLVADGLFEQLTLEADSSTERRMTADAYSGFAADLLTVPAPARAAEMLSRGLELAPDDTDAGIALAVLLLRDRRPNDAESRLDHVLKTQPANREARLRRALMRAGFSADGRAAQELEKLALTGETDWIALVAAQERARRLLATGNYDKSIGFLNRVLERFPGDSSLRVALAFASARASRRAEAYIAAQSALAARASGGEGARRIFAELPIRLLRQQATRANAAAEERRPKLAQAIASFTPPAPARPEDGVPPPTAPTATPGTTAEASTGSTAPARKLR
jgi:tetratricopeptide (TPR) repeat protein